MGLGCEHEHRSGGFGGLPFRLRRWVTGKPGDAQALPPGLLLPAHRSADAGARSADVNRRIGNRVRDPKDARRE